MAVQHDSAFPSCVGTRGPTMTSTQRRARSSRRQRCRARREGPPTTDRNEGLVAGAGVGVLEVTSAASSLLLLSTGAVLFGSSREASASQ